MKADPGKQTAPEARGGPGARESRSSRSADSRSGSARSGLRTRSCPLRDEDLRLEALLGEERAAHRRGCASVAGVDEVGRGCLAGPVYAAAVVLDVPVRGLDDSKVLPAEVRDELSSRIEKTSRAAVGAATAAEIDALGIAEATLLAMRRALAHLEEIGARVDLVLFDAVTMPGLGIPQKSFVRGDARVACIAAASIVAKSARDRHMESLHREFPFYGFESHRGYGTPGHLSALRRHGPSPEHRFSFEGVLSTRREA